MAGVQLANSVDNLQIPFQKCFSGHETFAFRYSWLKKGLDGVRKNPEVFQNDDSIVTLGVGKNMVRSIRHWCLATGIAEEEAGSRGRRLLPSNIGSRLLVDGGWDPYLEDDATLWLLHWKLASTDTRAATWYWAFNRFFEYTFTRAAMAEALTRHLQTLGWMDISNSTIKRDVDCFVHTYVERGSASALGDDSIECPLTGLGLLIQEPDGERIRFRVGPKNSLPAAIFTYSLIEFWKTKAGDRDTLEIHDIMSSEGSPSLVFKLDEDSVLSYLDQLESLSGGAYRFSDTPLTRSVIKEHDIRLDSMFFLEAYYESK